MLFFVKFLKILLPVATTTAATIATTFLVSFGKQDPKNTEEDVDKGLDDFQKPSEKFEDKKMYYSTKGQAKGLTKLDEKSAERLAQKLKDQRDDVRENAPNTIPEEVTERQSNSGSKGDSVSRENNLDQGFEETQSSPTSESDSSGEEVAKGVKQTELLGSEEKSENEISKDSLDEKDIKGQDGKKNDRDLDNKQDIQRDDESRVTLENDSGERSNDIQILSNAEHGGKLDLQSKTEDTSEAKDVAKTKEQDLSSYKEAGESGQKSLKSEKSDEGQEGLDEKGNDGEQNTGASVDSSAKNMNSTKGLDSISERGDSSPQTPSKEDLEKLLDLESELSSVKAKLDLLVN